MSALFLAQALMSYNVAAVPVSLGGIVDSFDVSPTEVSTALVMYGLVVAALVMVGAKIGQRIGWVRVFRVVIAMFAASALMMILAPSVIWVTAAQAVAGASAAVIVPSLVALIADLRGQGHAIAAATHDAEFVTAIGAARLRLDAAEEVAA